MKVLNHDTGKPRLVDFILVIDDLRSIRGWLARLPAKLTHWPQSGGGQCPLDELDEFHLQDIGIKRFEHQEMWADSRGAPLTAVRDFEYRQR